MATDHKALESLLSSKNLNSRLYRLSMKLQARDVEVVYRPGKLNDNPDCLSRQEWGAYQGTCMGRKEKDRTKEQLDIAPDFNGSVQRQTEALTEMELNLKEGAQNSGGGCGVPPHMKGGRQEELPTGEVEMWPASI